MRVVTIGVPQSGADVEADPGRFGTAVAAAFALSRHVLVWPGQYSADDLISVPDDGMLDLGMATITYHETIEVGANARLRNGIMQDSTGTIEPRANAQILHTTFLESNHDIAIFIGDEGEGVIIDGCTWYGCSGQLIRVTRLVQEGGHVRIANLRCEQHQRTNSAGKPVSLILLEEGVRFCTLVGLQIGRSKVGGGADAPVIHIAGSPTLQCGSISIAGIEIHNSGSVGIHIEEAKGVSVTGFVHALGGPNAVPVSVDTQTTSDIVTAGVTTGL